MTWGTLFADFGMIVEFADEHGLLEAIQGVMGTVQSGDMYRDVD